MVWRIHFSEDDPGPYPGQPDDGAAGRDGAGLQALLDVPREHLLVEMEYTDRWHRLSALAWAMAEAGGRAELTDAAQAAYRELVQPFWPRIRACLHAEQTARRRTLAREGPGALRRG